MTVGDSCCVSPQNTWAVHLRFSCGSRCSARCELVLFSFVKVLLVLVVWGGLGQAVLGGFTVICIPDNFVLKYALLELSDHRAVRRNVYHASAHMHSQKRFPVLAGGRNGAPLTSDSNSWVHLKSQVANVRILRSFTTMEYAHPGAGNMEDLWLPYFCLTTNITKGWWTYLSLF